MFSRMTPPVRRRLYWLAAGNLVLLAVIAFRLLSGDGGSGWARFGNVLAGIGPNIAPEMLAGLGLTAIIWAGAIDISIGSIIAVAGAVFAVLYSRGADPWACGAGCGLTAWGLVITNGLLVRWLRISPIILTLAGLAAYRGLAQIVTDLGIENFFGNVTVNEPEFHVPGQQLPAWIMLGALLVALAWECFGRLPRIWMAHGSSPNACRLHGLSPDGVQLTAFLCGGGFIALASLVHVTNLQTIDPARMALGFELSVIAAVVLGGTNIFGGEGSFLGTALGVLFLYLARETLIYVDVSVYAREAFQGALIVTVIGIDCALHRTRQRMEELK